MIPAGATSPIESPAAAYWAMLRRIAVWAACIDVGFLVLYSLLGAKALALMNLASVALYTTAWWLLRLRHNQAAVSLIWFEVLAHATVGSLLLGWQADFHLFLLLFVPGIVVGAPHRRALPLMVLLLASYAALYAACKAWAPLSPLPPEQLEVARWFNIVMVFGLFYAVAAFYRQRVRRAEQALRQLARVDALTQLANRTHFQERAAAEISRARREQQPLTLMLADVDHFKQVNDQHGHEAGDRVLAAVARAMAGALREHDVLARWGGEEFMALLPATDAALARSVAERVRDAVAAQPVAVDGRSVPVRHTTAARSPGAARPPGAGRRPRPRAARRGAAAIRRHARSARRRPAPARVGCYAAEPRRASRHTARVSMASPSPTGPIFSAVLAFTFTRSAGRPSSAAMRSRMAPMCGAIFGAWATMVLSTFTGSQPASRTRCTATCSRRPESAPWKAGSVSGKWRPMSPRPAAPSSASVRACSSASASEWPSRPLSKGIVMPPSTSGRPSTRRCVSQPSPMRMSQGFIVSPAAGPRARSRRAR